MGAQKGLVLSITFEEGIVRWSGARPDTSSTNPSRLIGMVDHLPYQDGSTLPTGDDHNSTEIMDSATTTESRTQSATRHSREVFMAGQPPRSLCLIHQTSRKEKKLYLISAQMPRHTTQKRTNRR